MCVCVEAMERVFVNGYDECIGRYMSMKSLTLLPSNADAAQSLAARSFRARLVLPALPLSTNLAQRGFVEPPPP